MGKRSWKKKRQNQHGENNEKGVRKNYDDIIKENANFEKYYKLQSICPESEWEDFMNTVRTSLPATFRITGSRSQAKVLLSVIEEKLIEGLTNVEDQVKPFPLPWYPEKLAWQINLTRKDIRRNEANFRLHNFLINETESGNISRQEAVSMIPPLVLDVQPHHKVLDMCAAPGSKTAQIIEKLHSNTKCSPDGFLIANDMDNKRCYMLVHQAKRLQSPAFMITNQDASNYPNLFISDEAGTKKIVKFDRVLCDVPCSGDGTIRKNVDVWRKWGPGTAIFLHQTQYLILKRGLELSEIGGQVVYSTCSLNPIENEAVVYRILKEFDGSVELMDISLPHLKYSPGLSTWKACGSDIVPYCCLQDVPQMWKSLLREHHFPPKETDSSKFHLEKCVRILPHQQDSGGFFVARFQKVKALSKENERVVGDTKNTEAAAAGKSKPKKSRMNPGFKEDPYIFMTESDPVWPKIREFYTLDPLLDSTNFLTRSLVDRKKNIYFTTALVKNIVTNNAENVKIINTGIKTFARADNKFTTCEFRLAQEGLQSLLPFIKGRTVTVSKEDLIILLMNDEEHTPPLLETLSKQTQVQLVSMERGSLVLIMDGDDTRSGQAFRIELIGWRGLTSLRAYVSLNDRVHYLLLCGGDVSKFEKNKFQIQSERSESQASESANGDAGQKSDVEAMANEVLNNE